MKMPSLDWVAWMLVIIGALNLGLVGAFDYNVLTRIFGEATTATQAVYILVGLGALYMIYAANKKKRS